MWLAAIMIVWHASPIRVNQKIARVVDEIAELEFVRSVDEFQVALGGSTGDLDKALALGRDLKKAIRTKVGSELRCSIGIGPNHLLAKIAGKLEKPDGLCWLAPENMPQRIAHLALDDLSGISRGITTRLYRAGVTDVAELYRLDPRHARLIWNSVEGERFVRALQGMDIPLLPTTRNGYGNSKVLAPRYRAPAMALLVGRWLTEKACERMRRDGYCSQRFQLQVVVQGKRGWSDSRKTAATQDTKFVLTVYEELWKRMTSHGPREILSVGVHLGDVIRLEDRNGDLFSPLSPGRASEREKLSKAVDRLNRRFGTRVVTFGLQQDHPGFFEKG